MAKLVLCLAGERYDRGNDDRGWKLLRYARLGDYEDGDKVTDCNYLSTIVEYLCDPARGSSWDMGEPKPGERTFFEIYIIAKNHSKRNAQYGIDYHTFAGCPQRVIEEGMEVYRIIKTEGIRPCVMALKRQRDLAKGKIKAVFAKETNDQVSEASGSEVAQSESTSFRVGSIYEAIGQDAFGHVIKQEVKIVARMPEASKVVFVSAHRSRPIVTRVCKEDNGECFQHKSLCGEVHSNRIIKAKGNT